MFLRGARLSIICHRSLVTVDFGHKVTFFQILIMNFEVHIESRARTHLNVIVFLTFQVVLLITTDVIHALVGCEAVIELPICTI